MKKITKVALGLAGTAAVGAAGTYALLNVLDNLLVDRKWAIPKSVSTKIAGTNPSALDDLRNEYMNWLENHGYENYSIVSDRGYQLVGYLMKPEQPSDVYVLCSHGYRCDGKTEYCGIAQYYLKRGFNVLLVDHVASGGSEGKYVGFGAFEHSDCIKWLGFLNDTFGSDIKLILHGVSMGAATVMLMSGDERLPENVKMIVSDCGYTSAWDEFEYELKGMKIPTQPLLNWVNAINKRKAGYDFKADTNAIESVKKAKVPMLFVHGGGDNFVPTYMVYLNYDACGSEYKDLLVVEGANHAESFVDGREEYEAKLDEFVEKFIEPHVIKQ